MFYYALLCSLSERYEPPYPLSYELIVSLLFSTKIALALDNSRRFICIEQSEKNNIYSWNINIFETCFKKTSS